MLWQALSGGGAGQSQPALVSFEARPSPQGPGLRAMEEGQEAADV